MKQRFNIRVTGKSKTEEKLAHSCIKKKEVGVPVRLPLMFN